MAYFGGLDSTNKEDNLNYYLWLYTVYVLKNPYNKLVVLISPCGFYTLGFISLSELSALQQITVQLKLLGQTVCTCLINHKKTHFFFV